MAKRHLEQYDKNGNMLDIYLNEEEVMVGDQTLAEKLADMEDDIDDAAQTGGEGTVTGIKVGSNTYEPTEGVVDISGAVPTSTSDLSNNSDFTTKAYVDAAVQAVQTALNNLMNGQSVTDAIDTFNEIVDFLDDIDTDDPTLANQLLALNNSITALQTALAGKISGIKTSDNTPLTPDSNGIVTLPPAGSTISPATASPSMDGTANVGSSEKYAREDHVHPHDSSKQNTLTFDTTPTAGHTTQVMSSDAIKTALDAKANAADVPTNQDMADAIDDALGEAQVTAVPASSVGIISSLGSDSDSDALSASMGKKLKVALLTILNSLGNYAFPDGKPVIDWGDDTPVTYTVTYPTDSKVTHTGAGDTVELGSSLEVTLGIASGNDLYVIKDSSVKVYMSGVEQSGAYNASTQKVTLAAVTGNVVIVAEAMTYEQNGLVLHLDCRHRGGTGTEVSGHWKSLVNYGQSPIDFALGSAVVAADTGMVFDGSSNSYAETDTALNVMATDGTIEVVASIIDSESNAHFNIILVNPIENAIGLSIHNVSNDSSHRNAVIMMGRSDSSYSGVDKCWAGRVGDTTTDFAIAVTAGTPNGVGHNKGTELTLSARYHLVVDATANNKLMIGRVNRSAGNRYLVGTIRSIRVYSGHLSADQQHINWLIDKKRFNL